jgi:protein-tyrosine phosphatase
MSSDPTITPPPIDTPETVPVAPPRLRFSGARWFFTGIIRVMYRAWTRLAVRLFPEGSQAELNMSWVTKNLAVGGRIRPEDISALARAGVTHVIDTRSERRDDAQALAKEDIQLLYLPTRDTYPLTVEKMMEGAEWVHQAIQKDGRVLIHCEHGVGRSVQLTCAVLIYEEMHAQDALLLVQQKRWQAAPNHKQVERLREFESRLNAARRASSNPSPSA